MRLHLVDGTYELFRAHFSKRPEHARPTAATRKATVGLVVVAAAAGRRSEGGGDPPRRSRSTIRSARFATISSTATRPKRACRRSCSRSSTPPRRRCARSASSSGRWTAGRPTTRWPPRRRASPTAVEQVRILTPDKDLGQCIAGAAWCRSIACGEREIDEAALVALRGVGPASIPDLAGAHRRRRRRRARACPASATRARRRCWRSFEHLEQIPDDPRAWPATVRGAERLARTLAGARAEALLYRSADAPGDRRAAAGVARRSGVARRAAGAASTTGRSASAIARAEGPGGRPTAARSRAGAEDASRLCA